MFQQTNPTRINQHLSATINPILVSNDHTKFRRSRSGWKIRGRKIQEGPISWVPNFEAVSPLGRVSGSLKGVVSFDNQAALDDFLLRHQPIRFRQCQRGLYKISKRVFNRYISIVDANPMRVEINGSRVVQFLDPSKRLMAEIVTRGRTQEYYLREGQWLMYDVIGPTGYVGCHLAKSETHALERLGCGPGRYVVQNLATNKVETIEIEKETQKGDSHDETRRL